MDADNACVPPAPPPHHTTHTPILQGKGHVLFCLAIINFNWAACRFSNLDADNLAPPLQNNETPLQGNALGKGPVLFCFGAKGLRRLAKEAADGDPAFQQLELDMYRLAGALGGQGNLFETGTLIECLDGSE